LRLRKDKRLNRCNLRAKNTFCTKSAQVELAKKWLLMKKRNVNLQMSVSDLLTELPQVIPVFIQHRMACVGCSMSSFETLGDAAKIYGIAPEVLLEEIFQVIDTEHQGSKANNGGKGADW
jgi:hybrid cluster-associated redox disulfide protein